MKTEVSITTTDDRVATFISDLESQKTILTSCTQLFTSLSNHFISLQNSLNQRSQTLESNLHSLQSTSRQTLDSLSARETSIPHRESDATIKIESKRQAAIVEFKTTDISSYTLSDALKSLCRRMDSSALLKFIVLKRKESAALREGIANAVAEAVDGHTLLLDAVDEYVMQRIERVGGVTDKRWACGILVQAVFPEGVEKYNGLRFAKSLVERAVEIGERWKRVFDDDFEGGTMGPAEAVMFLQVVSGFGICSKFDEEFVMGLVVQFSGRRDMAKLAAGLGFSEKLEGIVDELVKGGKEIDAIYFAIEAGLTEKFPPISLLKSHLRISKKNAITILKNNKYSATATATEESNTVELNSIRAVIKCVEDLKLESEFSLESLKKRATHLEKTKAESKKRSSSSTSKPQNNKRGHHGSSSGGPPSRPTKASKFSNSHSSFGRRNPAPPPVVSPATRYSGPYTYPSQAVYEAQPMQYTTYGVPQAQSTLPLPQPHYSHPGSSYDAQISYTGSYDYGRAPSTTYPST
ncbi:hypothetical protein ACFE04_016826 [Oxalis oulophora]